MNNITLLGVDLAKNKFQLCVSNVNYDCRSYCLKLKTNHQVNN